MPGGPPRPIIIPPLCFFLKYGTPTQSLQTNFTRKKLIRGGGVAQRLGRRISDQGVPGSNPDQCTFRCGLELHLPCLVLVEPRKRCEDDRIGQTVTRLEITLRLMC